MIKRKVLGLLVVFLVSVNVYGGSPVSGWQNKTEISAVIMDVEDLQSSLAFYTNGLAMQEVESRSCGQLLEVTLQSADGRGSDIVLRQSQTGGLGTHYGKLVFYVNDPQAFAFGIFYAGGQILLPPTPVPELGGIVVGFARDINHNLIEIVGAEDAQHSYFAAFGLGVSDLQLANEFYRALLDVEDSQFLQTASYDEYILTPQGGSALVLMHWTNGLDPDYQNQPVGLRVLTSKPRKKVVSLLGRNGSLGKGVGRGIFIEDPDGTAIRIKKIRQQQQIK